MSKIPVSTAIAVLWGCGAVFSGLGATVAFAQLAAPIPLQLDTAQTPTPIQRLSMQEFAQLVAQSDELIRAQAIESFIADQGLRGAKAIYEPLLTTVLSREGRYAPTSAEEALSRGQSGSDTITPAPYESAVSQLKLAVGVKAPSGADIELAYNIDSITNSLQRLRGEGQISPEYRGSIVLSINQPLLRGFGREVTEAGIRIAEREQTIARETVRLVTAQRVLEALQAYLLVQRAQQRVHWRQRALELSTQLEHEINRQQRVGLKSQNELNEARAQLALRQAQHVQALQELEEQSNALQVFLSAHAKSLQLPTTQRWLPLETLVMPEEPYAVSLQMTDLQSAFDQRPETRVNRIRIEREDLRSFVAEDQAKPDLSLRVRYGKESLLEKPAVFKDYFSSAIPYNNWAVGITLKIPLGGDIKKDSEWQTALLRKNQAELALGAAQQRINNELLSVKSVLDRSLQLASQQNAIVEAQTQLLTAEKRMMQEGQKSLLDVLRREIELTVAQEAFTDAVMQVNRSSLLASQANGSLLNRLGIE